jgi:Ca2+-transporting ATPase
MAHSENWHEKDAAAVVRELHSSSKGLSGHEARRRLAQYGPNVIKRQKKISRLAIFLSQFRSLLVIILIIAAVISAVVLQSVVDSAVIMVIVIINAIVGYVQEYKAERAVEALKKMTTPEAVVLREGKQQKIESSSLVPGDVVLLDEGTRIPADLRLLEVVNLKIDEAALTGESAPVTKTIAQLKDVPIADRTCMAYMGTLVTYGRGEGIITATGMQTEIGKIAHMIEEAEEGMTPLQQKLDSFGKKLAVFILVISVLVMAIMLLRSGVLFGSGDTGAAIKDAFLLGIALAIAAIPEGLPAVATITMALGLQRLSKKNALVRKLPAVETLGSTSVICSDKTGTLTRNEMMVRKIYCEGRIFEVTGRGYIPSGEFLQKGTRIHPEKIAACEKLLRTAILCNNASLGKGDTIIGDPTEGACLVAAAKAFDLEEINKKYPRKGEFPFSSERKRMTTINKVTVGLEAYMKGAPEIVLERCTHTFRNGKVHRLTSEERKRILAVNHSLSREALRVLGFAFKQVKSAQSEKEAEQGLVFVGMMGMIDPPRKEVRELIVACHRSGIKTIMITGDHKNTAVAIAKELQLYKEGHRALTGQELDAMSDKKLEQVVETVTVYARVDPKHKLRIVKALKKKYIVAMTGDGVNDAPALKKADIGVAMGIKGTDVAKEASDMILKDDNFGTIVSAVEEGRAIYDNIKKFILYLLSSNVGEVLVIFFGLLLFTNLETATVLLPVQLLWINLLTDGPPATAIGVDPPARGIMERKPRNPKSDILNRDMLMDIMFVGVVFMVGTLYLFQINLAAGETVARTVAFTTLVMFEMVRVHSVRAKYGMTAFSNHKLLLAIAASILLQIIVVYVPVLQGLFGTAALGMLQWGQILLASFIVFVIMWGKGLLEKK